MGGHAAFPVYAQSGYDDRMGERLVPRRHQLTTRAHQTSWACNGQTPDNPGDLHREDDEPKLRTKQLPGQEVAQCGNVFQDLLRPAGFVTACRGVLRLVELGLPYGAVPCSSYFFMSAGSHRRSETHPWGEARFMMEMPWDAGSCYYAL